MEPLSPVLRRESIRPALSIRLAAAAVAFVLTGLFGLFAWDDIHQSSQIDSLIHSLRVDDRAVAASNQNSNALLAYVQDIADQQAAENRWLVRHHFPVPVRFLHVIPSPRLVHVSGQPSLHRHKSGATLHRHHVHVSPPPTGHKHHHGKGHGHKRVSLSKMLKSFPGRSAGHRHSRR